MSDLISRAEAIDTEGLDEEIRCEICRNPMHTSRGCDGNCTYDEKLYEKIMQILDRRIKDIPSAQPEQQWIPATERLPEDDGMYYVTIKDGAGEVDAVPCVWYDKKWAIGGAEVIAWIAIPEPYKEERKEE